MNQRRPCQPCRFHTFKTRALLAGRPVYATVVDVAGVLVLRNGSTQRSFADSAVFGRVLSYNVEPRTDSFQLFFHDAAGCLADVLLPDNLRVDERFAHARVEHAAVGAVAYVAQSAALLYRVTARLVP